MFDTEAQAAKQIRLEATAIDAGTEYRAKLLEQEKNHWGGITEMVRKLRLELEVLNAPEQDRTKVARQQQMAAELQAARDQARKEREDAAKEVSGVSAAIKASRRYKLDRVRDAADEVQTYEERAAQGRGTSAEGSLAQEGVEAALKAAQARKAAAIAALQSDEDWFASVARTYEANLRRINDAAAEAEKSIPQRYSAEDSESEVKRRLALKSIQWDADAAAAAALRAQLAQLADIRQQSHEEWLRSIGEDLEADQSAVRAAASKAVQAAIEGAAANFAGTGSFGSFAAAGEQVAAIREREQQELARLAGAGAAGGSSNVFGFDVEGASDAVERRRSTAEQADEIQAAMRDARLRAAGDGLQADREGIERRAAKAMAGVLGDAITPFGARAGSEGVGGLVGLIAAQRDLDIERLQKDVVPSGTAGLRESRFLTGLAETSKSDRVAEQTLATQKKLLAVMERVDRAIRDIKPAKLFG